MENLAKLCEDFARKRGRPRVVEGQDTEPITVRVELPLYDEICRRAQDQNRDMADLVRVVLRHYCNQK